MNIPVSRPSVGREELRGVEEVFKAGWLGMGSVVFEFENLLKKYLGARNIIAVNTGTSALHIALCSMGIKSGDEVILPSLTFASSPQAVLMCGAKTVFCDIEEDTLNMCVADVKKKITRKTKAIMPVHYSGLPCDMDSILALAKKHGLRVVEDAAHAFGSVYNGKKIGSFGDVTCFSFDPIKLITCGEGGAVVTDDDTLAKKIVRKRMLGIDKDTYSRYRHKRNWFYEVNEPGFRYHLSNINAAIGLAQMKKVDMFVDRRKVIARMYDRALDAIEGISLIKKDYDEVAPFNYIIKVRNNRREKLMAFMEERGVESGVHYIPNHIQPLFKNLKTRLPHTDKIAGQILTLPLYYGMSDKDVKKVSDSVREYFSEVSLKWPK